MPINVVMRRILLTATAALLVFSRVSAAADDPARTAREFMRAVYSNDAVQFAATTVPNADSSKLLGKQPLSSERLAEVAEATARLRLEQVQPFTYRGTLATPAGDGSYPPGTITRYLTSFRGVPMVISMVRDQESWKVDVRWWLAMIDLQRSPRPSRGSPEFAIKALLTTVISGNRDDAARFTTPTGDVGVVFQGTPRRPDPSDQFIALALEMPLVESQSGEYYKLPSGEIADGSPLADRKVLVGLYGPHELVFAVRKVGDEWRVEPQAYYPLMNK